MTKNVLEDVCPICIHKLVIGVACDWKHNECPFTNKNKQTKK